jgi:hypothetical protein
MKKDTDPLHQSTRRLEQLLQRAVHETDPTKAAELTDEIYRVVARREELRRSCDADISGVDPADSALDALISHILTRAPEPLFAPDILDEINSELGDTSGFSLVQITLRLVSMADAAQLPDGRWTLKKFLI